MATNGTRRAGSRVGKFTIERVGDQVATINEFYIYTAFRAT